MGFKNVVSVGWVSVILFATGCGGGGGSDTPRQVEQTAAQLSITYLPTKKLQFSWTDQAEATSYKLFIKTDTGAGFEPIGTEFPPGVQTFTQEYSLHQLITASFLLETCFDIECKPSEVIVDPNLLSNAIGFFKGSDTSNGDSFGTDVAVNAAGTLMAVSAHNWDAEADRVGVVYLFEKVGQEWEETAKIQPTDVDASDQFGVGLAMNGAGDLMAVGAREPNSSGAVYVFGRETDGSWLQQAKLQADIANEDDLFGEFVALSSDGTTLAVGAHQHDSASGGINTPVGERLFSVNSTGDNYGSAYVFVKQGDNWVQQAYIQPASPVRRGFFGRSLELSADGNQLVVGGGIARGNTDESTRAGHFYVFARDGEIWQQQTLVFDEQSLRAFSVAITESGDQLAAYSHQKLDENPEFGFVVIYQFDGENWVRLEKFTVPFAEFNNAGNFNRNEITFSADGQILIVGDTETTACGAGFVSDITETCVNSGALAVYRKSSDPLSNWSLESIFQAKNVAESDQFGRRLAVSQAGDLIVVGSLNESSGGVGINPEEAGKASGSGAVFLY